MSAQVLDSWIQSADDEFDREDAAGHRTEATIAAARAIALRDARTLIFGPPVSLCAHLIHERDGDGPWTCVRCAEPYPHGETR